jgi:hypothetical protein
LSNPVSSAPACGRPANTWSIRKRNPCKQEPGDDSPILGRLERIQHPAGGPHESLGGVGFAKPRQAEREEEVDVGERGSFVGQHFGQLVRQTGFGPVPHQPMEFEHRVHGTLGASEVGPT